MIKLLVNADDFGLSAAINGGIIAAHLNGIVTSTSIVASGEAFETAVRDSRLYPSLDIGVHLTLVEEKAVSKPALIPTLAPDGQLPVTYGKLMKGLAGGRVRLRDIELEFRAQIEKCLTAGFALTHLDSHQHTHAFPPLFAMTVRLANEYNIRGIRIPRSWPVRRHWGSSRFVGKCILCALAYADALLFRRGHCAATKHTAGLFESGDLTEENLLWILSGLRSGSTELICHPGEPDSVLKYASWNHRRQVELASLTSGRVKAAIHKAGIQLIGYGQL